MSISAASPDRSPASLASPSGPRRVWFPIVWPLVLAGIAAGFWFSGIDPGVAITATHIGVVLAVLGLAVWTVRSSGLSRRVRWSIALAPCLALAAFYLQLLPVKTINDGDTGIVGWRWRWAEPDRQLTIPASSATKALDWKETPHDYPRFLGNGYWAEVTGVELETDWEKHPPRPLWKQEIGAGWSGFAVVGDYAVTQEQRGERELVVCYEVRTGKVAWTHADAVRWDPRNGGSLGGIGPRATPTIHDGMVFTHGATGILNCLVARTGELLWSHDTLAENGAENIMWGKAGSPLIVDDRVVVSMGGGDNASLVAYDIVTGKKVWGAGWRRSSYATPVLTDLAGVRQIVTVDEDSVTGHDAADGRILWEHEWLGSSDTNASASQPVPVGDDRLFLSKGYGEGAELIKIKQDDRGFFRAESVWKDKSVMRTKMSNVVIRDGYVYGLNEVFFQCIELNTGKNRWKKRRTPSFGHGQIMLVGDAILMLSEQGELILIEASPKAYHELASMPALEGVTWNNPSLSGRLLLVRNAKQAACFELSVREASASAGGN
jgi:outer membrane protein assembly factor BamB